MSGLDPFSAESTTDDGVVAVGVSLGGSTGRSGLAAAAGTAMSTVLVGFSTAGLVSVGFWVSVEAIWRVGGGFRWKSGTAYNCGNERESVWFRL